MQSIIDALRINKQAKAFGVKFDTQVMIENYFIKDELHVREYQLN